jgi:DHA2 family multidrug resistance protein
VRGEARGPVANRPSGIAALNAEVTRQAAMVAYVNDFALMMIIAIGSCMLLLLVRPPPRAATTPAIAVGSGNMRPGQAD